MPFVARLALATIGLAVVLVLFGAPLLPWPPVVRLPAVLVPALALAVLVARPWSWPDFDRRASEWRPSRLLVWSAAVVVGLLLFWFVLTRFRSGQINAIDFAIYYDRPCFQTVQGRPLFVEVSDTPGFSYRSELADHGYWGMLAICSLYAIRPTPLWLHAISVLAVVSGAVLVLRALQHLGAGGVLASAAALAFVLNDNTARTLNYGFHPEVLYACFVPWMILAGLRGARASFLVATFACVLVKEDAFLPAFAVSVALALNRLHEMNRSDRLLFLGFPTSVALASLGVYWAYVLPLLTPDGQPQYAHFWGNYGDTPMLALAGMCAQPGRVLQSTMTSGISSVLQPLLFLPLIGWRWALGVLPIVLLYGASANEQIRAFGIYYSIVLVPFIVVAASMGALALARSYVKRRGHAQVCAAGVILLGALLVGSGNRGYSLRPWRPEIAAVPEALGRLAGEPVVLVQSGLFPHSGYDQRHRLLTPETLDDPHHEGAAVLLAPGVSAYPFRRSHLTPLMDLPRIRRMPGGLTAVRLSKQP